MVVLQLDLALGMWLRGRETYAITRRLGLWGEGLAHTEAAQLLSYTIAGWLIMWYE